MQRFTRGLTIAGLLTAAATPALAQMTYSETGRTRIGYRTTVEIANTPTFDTGTVFWAEGFDSMFTSSVQDFNYTAPLNLGDYPTISNFNQDYSVRTQASSDRFELSWNGVSNAELLSPLFSPDSVQTNLVVQARFDLAVTENTQLRISWSGAAGNVLAPDLPEVNFNRISIGVTPQNGSFVPFDAGIGDDDNTVTQPFSFLVDVAAGETINFNFSMLFLTSSQDGAYTASGWDQFQNSSFVVEVVPAPGSLALLGISGMAFVRRRR